MYNHARTLLVNLPGASGFASDVPADELIPQDFNPTNLPRYLLQFRQDMFGTDPDRGMLNYRAQQLLSLISSTELQQYVTDLDPRITYADADPSLMLAETFEPVVSPFTVVGSSNLTVLGSQISPDVTGQTRYHYVVKTDAGNLLISTQHSTAQDTVTPLVLTSGLSQAVPLPLSGYSVRVNTTADGNVWSVKGTRRPTRSLLEVLESMRNKQAESYLKLFGSQPKGPYKTFYNCWNSHPEMAYQLGGIVMAMIYRTQELRNA